MRKSNTLLYAERELDILLKTVKDPIIAPFTTEILALCDKFGQSGQSGGSAPMTATVLADSIKKLCLQEPICEITGIKEEWMDVSDALGGNPVYQNTRCSALFKKGAMGRPYYLDAIVFKNQNGIGYSSNCGAILKDGSRVRSRQYVKAFPFKPKTFYIDVIEKEISKDDWEFYVKDESQLEAVFKYYDFFEKAE